MRHPEVARALALLLMAPACCAAQAADDGLVCPAAGASGAEIAARDSAPEALFTRPESTVPASKRTTRGLYLTARDAYEMVQEEPAKVLFVDVRTRGELQFNGMPASIDVNVPFMMQAEPPQWDATTSSLKLVANPRFDERIASPTVVFSPT